MNTDDDPGDAAVEALMTTTRALVGIATRALSGREEEMTLPAFRLLLALADVGPAAGAVVAARLGTAASSVTRLGDGLEASGHLTRRRDPANRSVVVLALTDAGAAVVHAVLDRRRGALREVVERIPPGERAALAAALTAFVDAAGSDTVGGPLELTSL